MTGHEGSMKVWASPFGFYPGGNGYGHDPQN